MTTMVTMCQKATCYDNVKNAILSTLQILSLDFKVTTTPLIRDLFDIIRFVPTFGSSLLFGGRFFISSDTKTVGYCGEGEVYRDSDLNINDHFSHIGKR
jgi:hypothetical protein